MESVKWCNSDKSKVITLPRPGMHVHREGSGTQSIGTIRAKTKGLVTSNQSRARHRDLWNRCVHGSLSDRLTGIHPSLLPYFSLLYSLNPLLFPALQLGPITLPPYPPYVEQSARAGITAYSLRNKRYRIDYVIEMAVACARSVRLGSIPPLALGTLYDFSRPGPDVWERMVLLNCRSPVCALFP